MTKIKQFLAFLGYVAKTFDDDRCLRIASALTYTTLLSLVPLSTVIFSVFAAFPMFESFSGQIQSFVFDNFVPTSGDAIQGHLEEFANKTSRLTAIGSIFLIFSALLMMNTIEGALNDVWNIKSSRKAIPKFMVYWAMLTLGPILMGASLALTSYLTSLSFFSDPGIIADIKTKLLGLLPFFATTLACTLLYSVVPNIHVPLRYALSGAVVAGILFELAKKGFALYVTAFPTYELIYGALATIPVFLVWLYVSWMVIMLGAEITYCLYHKQSNTSDSLDSNSQRILNDFKILGLMWQAQTNNRLLNKDELVENTLFGQLDDIDDNLDRLQQNKLIHQTIDGELALSKDSSRLTLADLYRGQSGIQINLDTLKDDPWANALGNTLRQSNKLIDDALGYYLQPLYQKLMSQKKPDTAAIATSKSQRKEPTIKL